MIQYPTNVYPQNQAIDASVPNFTEKFVFNGDYLSGLWTRIFDYDTGEMVREDWYRDNNLPIVYNGDEIQHRIDNHNLTNGGRYVFQMMLVQRTKDGYYPLCDMPVVGGKIELSVDNSNIAYISKGITSIYPWGKSGNTYTPNAMSPNNYFNPMEIQIGTTKRTIVSYEDEYDVDGTIYGKLTLDGNITANAGDYYRIYSNSLITPQYFFVCNSAPVMSFPSYIAGNKQLEVGWSYSQAEGVPMKYYILRLWWSSSHTYGEDTRRLIEETNRIYSQYISYNFKSPFYHDYTADNPAKPDYYRIEIEGVTQNGMAFSAREDFVIQPHDYRENPTPGRILHGFDASEDRDSGGAAFTLRGYMAGSEDELKLFRQYLRYDPESGEDVPVGEDEFVGWTHTTWPDEGIMRSVDISCSSRGRYRYSAVMFASDGGAIIPALGSGYDKGNFPTDTIELEGSAYYITALYDQTYTPSVVHLDDIPKRKTYKLGDTWKFAGEISNTTVTNNLDTMVHVGYGQYVSTTSTDVNYESGTLSAMIGYVNCTTRKYVDDIALVKAWRKFITQKVPFLLKSQKGDVWIVTITDNPTTEYDETVRSIPTTFSFSWAECDSVDNAIFIDPV